MPLFTVKVKQVVLDIYEGIEADSAEEAEDIVQSGELDPDESPVLGEEIEVIQTS